MNHSKEFLKKVVYSSVSLCNGFIQNRMEEMAEIESADRDSAWQATYSQLVKDWEKCDEILEHDLLILSETDREVFQGFDPQLTLFLKQTFYDCKEFITDMYEMQENYKNISKEEKSAWTYEQRLQEFNVDNYIQEIEEDFETDLQQEMIEILNYLSSCKYNLWGERQHEEEDDKENEDELPF